MTCGTTAGVRGNFDGVAAMRQRGREHLWARLMALLVPAVLAAAAACAVPATAAAAAQPCAHASAAPSHLSTRAASHALECLINDVRAQHGLRPVRANARLALAARLHAGDMAAHDYFAHVSPDGATMQARVKRAGYLRRVHEWWLGEALAWGKARAGAPRAILRGLLDSPPHRAILLDPGFRDIGVGVAHGAPTGRGAGALTVALDFGRVRR